jgi:poly(beta-D-mannuronate) lyase
MNKSTVMIVTFLLLISLKLSAKEYKVQSAAEVKALRLSPGDQVILTGSNWKDQELIFKGKGTKEQPIVMKTEFPGQTRLTGNSTLKIDGTWLVVDGLSFADGYIEKGDVIAFSAQSSWCRLTNTSVVDYNNPDKKADYRWVSLYGFNNRVDHCFLKGKTTQATTLVVWLSDQPNYHHIDHNYFGPRPELGGNGGETIRIGTSTWSMYDSFTTVEYNIFEHCDGEIEAISNKSGKNTIRNNLFYECKATLTLRHGNKSEVYGNFFIGNYKPGTGGVRVIGEGHKVHDNYMQSLTGTGLSAAVAVMAGLPNPILTSHWQVKDATISNNLIVDCKEPFSVGAGYNQDRYLPALNTSFTDNIIAGNKAPVKFYDPKVDIAFHNNVLIGKSADVPAKGFTVSDLSLKGTEYGLFLKPGQAVYVPFWKTEKIGPDWAVDLGPAIRVESIKL